MVISYFDIGWGIDIPRQVQMLRSGQILNTSIPILEVNIITIKNIYCWKAFNEYHDFLVKFKRYALKPSLEKKITTYNINGKFHCIGKRMKTKLAQY